MSKPKKRPTDDLTLLGTYYARACRYALSAVLPVPGTKPTSDDLLAATIALQGRWAGRVAGLHETGMLPISYQSRSTRSPSGTTFDCRRK